MSNIEQRMPQTGDLVIYHDPVGNPHNALVTGGGFEYSPNQATGWLNVVFTCADPNMKDNYGRQLARETSVSHVSQTAAWGRYWRWPEEKANERL